MTVELRAAESLCLDARNYGFLETWALRKAMHDREAAPAFTASAALPLTCTGSTTLCHAYASDAIPTQPGFLLSRMQLAQGRSSARDFLRILYRLGRLTPANSTDGFEP